MTFYVTEVCKHCGNLRSICSDPTRPIYPQRTVCYASAVMAQTWRRVNAKYGHPEPKDGNLHFTDGLSIGASLHDLTPDDDFLATTEQEQQALRARAPATDSEADDQ